MSKYVVQIPIAGSISIEVEAADKKAALAAAWDLINTNEGPAEDVGEIEWEYFDVISEGNCCHAPCNEICVSKVRS